MQLVVVAIVGGHEIGVEEVHLAHRHPVALIGIEETADASQVGVGLRAIVQDRVRKAGDLGRFVGERWIFTDQVDDVHAEPVDSAIEPEAQRVLHCLDNLGVRPVQVRLLGQETVEVVLAGAFVECPRRTERQRLDPVVGRPAVGSRVAPHVPPAFRVVLRRARRPEPRMLIGGVVGYPIDDHPEPVPVGLPYQGVEGGEVAEQRVDVAEVGDVVAVVGHR